MSILPRMIAVGLRNYEERPEERASAARVMIINAMRLALEYLPLAEVERLINQAKRERKG